MIENKSIDKRTLWRFVNKKIQRSIHHYHVFSVITILFDELINDLKAGKSVKVFNFGSILLKDLNGRKYYDIHKKEIVMSKRHKIIRFILDKKIHKKLINLLDFNKTFNNHED